jgi:predicted phosphodiesterase
MIGFIGDVHGNFDLLFERMEQHKEIDSWVQVGDFGGETKSYKAPPKPLYFISGNHENWDEIEKMDKGFDQLFHIENGGFVDVGLEGIRILGFGGNYSPAYYNKKRIALFGERRRHFVEEDFNKAIELPSHLDRGIDIIISHEAPSPYMKGTRNMGQPLINELLRVIKPKLYFFGHHHYDSISEYEGIPSVGLGFGFKTYIQFDPIEFSIKRFPM